MCLVRLHTSVWDCLLYLHCNCVYLKTVGFSCSKFTFLILIYHQVMFTLNVMFYITFINCNIVPFGAMKYHSFILISDYIFSVFNIFIHSYKKAIPFIFGYWNTVHSSFITMLNLFHCVYPCVIVDDLRKLQHILIYHMDIIFLYVYSVFIANNLNQHFHCIYNYHNDTLKLHVYSWCVVLYDFCKIQHIPICHNNISFIPI